MEEETLALTSFGSALSLSTTLRHSIQSEITTLDNASSALLKNISNETSIQRSIAKEMERAKREMMELKRGGGDVVECSVVAGNVSRGWREDFENEIQSTLNEFVRSENDGEKGFLFQQKKILKEKQVKIATFKKELSETNAMLVALDEETHRIQDDVQRLNSQKEEVVHEVEKKKIEYQSEVRRNTRIKEDIGRSRGNSGGFAQEIAVKTQEQITQRSSNLTKEASLQTELDDKYAEMVRLSAEEKKLDTELTELLGLLDSYTQQLSEGKSEIERSTRIKVEMVELDQELEEMKKTKKTKEEANKDAVNALEIAKNSFERASIQAYELETIKAENDKANIEMLQPALARKAEASKEKERLVKEVNDLHRDMAEKQSELNEAIACIDTKASIKSKELKETQEKLVNAQSDFEILVKTSSAEEEINAKELQETKIFCAQFEAATEGEIARLETLKRQKTDERLATLDRRRSELASLEDIRREEIRYLKDAFALLERMRDIGTAIKDANVELTDDGDELNPFSREFDEAIAELKSRISNCGENNERYVNDRDDMITQASPSSKHR